MLARQPRVLVVGGCDIVRRMMLMLLTYDGLHTREAATLSHAKAWLAAEDFDLIVSNLDQGLDGVVPVREERPAWTPPKLLTLGAMRPDTASGAPFDVARFRAAVRRLIGTPPAPTMALSAR